MAFPTSPVDGHIYNDYKYNSVTSGWNQIGDILETGSNLNGHWIKYNNGVMIQYNYVSESFTTTTNQDHTITYPIPFIAIEFFTANARPLASWEGLSLIPFIYGSENRLTIGRLHINSTSAQSMADLSWQAIGRWK